MDWDWMFYDIIRDKKNGGYYILEITDTCGSVSSGGRKFTYYFKDGKWEKRQEALSPQEIIFNLFVLEERK